MVPLKHRGQVEHFLVRHYELDTLKTLRLISILFRFCLIKSFALISIMFQKSCFRINQSVMVKKEVSLVRQRPKVSIICVQSRREINQILAARN